MGNKSPQRKKNMRHSLHWKNPRIGDTFLYRGVHIDFYATIIEVIKHQRIYAPYDTDRQNYYTGYRCVLDNGRIEVFPFFTKDVWQKIYLPKTKHETQGHS